ncbi:unnamed protein product [Rangifer tarandus platyrhynchus]|uniref:Uncharacterized protein n=1 Tax=Rangifer tarandus platyrhynchus TaxID=3082113 RepID=A0ABN8XJG5_RANTA|nr:unnamed protein product [Rangifer tarandus platyrhynchus]
MKSRVRWMQTVAVHRRTQTGRVDAACGALGIPYFVYAARRADLRVRSPAGVPCPEASRAGEAVGTVALAPLLKVQACRNACAVRSVDRKAGSLKGQVPLQRTRIRGQTLRFRRTVQRRLLFLRGPQQARGNAIHDILRFHYGRRHSYDPNVTPSLYHASAYRSLTFAQNHARGELTAVQLCLNRLKLMSPGLVGTGLQGISEWQSAR